jgi:hypothetical protein
MDDDDDNVYSKFRYIYSVLLVWQTISLIKLQLHNKVKYGLWMTNTGQNKICLITSNVNFFTEFNCNIFHGLGDET